MRRLGGRRSGQPPDVSAEALDAVRVIAQRVNRFAADVERDSSEETRLRWRAAMDDLCDAIREARAAGWDTATIHAATQGAPAGRFVRPPASVLDPSTDAAPTAVA